MSEIKDSLGLENVGIIKRNGDVDSLMQDAVANEGAKISSTGALMIDTGIFTVRSPKDKFFVNQDPSNKYIAWGDINHKVSKEVYEDLLKTSKKQLSNKDIYVTDVYCGASLRPQGCQGGDSPSNRRCGRAGRARCLRCCRV